MDQLQLSHWQFGTAMVYHFRAQIASFIQRLPEGYDTWSGEQGLLLSGGERLRRNSRNPQGGRRIKLIMRSGWSLDTGSTRRVSWRRVCPAQRGYPIQ